MTKTVWLSGLVALLTASSAVLALSFDYPKKAYDATFATTSPTGATTMRLASDGKGHIMSETQTGNYHVISIFDYPGKVNLTIRPEERRIIRMPITGEHNPFAGMASKPPNATALGSKVIDGHPCKGWQYSAGSYGGHMDVWLADDIELAVRNVMTMKDGSTRTTVLKSYSPAMPPASLFVAPVGYTVMEASASPPP